MEINEQLNQTVEVSFGDKVLLAAQERAASLADEPVKHSVSLVFTWGDDLNGAFNAILNVSPKGQYPMNTGLAAVVQMLAGMLKGLERSEQDLVVGVQVDKPLVTIN